MLSNEKREEYYNHLIANALREDIGSGDVSSLSSIDENATGRALLKIKADGKLAGMDTAERIFRFMEPEAVFIRRMNDGDIMRNGDVAFEVTGTVRTILSCERLVLNCMQRMSGIATLTASYVEKLKGFPTRLLDTRKTTPNFRLLEKEAVRIGGGYNHRFGLFDMIMLKDNHIDYCGGLEKAILKAHDYVMRFHPGMEIEVETRSLSDVEEVLKVGKVNRIMFDNFSVQDMKKAVEMVKGRFETEASGGIHLGNITEYASTGVDFISSGAIIHQAVSVDLSLKAIIS
jgi:nicotinate-nucleotide pyrophosphorylase (carboxylating)